MKQIVIIHGGDSYARYDEFLNALKNWPAKKEWFQKEADWKSTLADKLGDGFDVLSPQMPNKQNAKYAEWKIWFEKMFPFLAKEVVLSGHSLGAMFLVKYLSEKNFPFKIASLHLVAPPHNQTGEIGDFVLPNSLQNVASQAANIHFYFSKDDPIVPFSEVKFYKKSFPCAQFHIFENRAHFRQKSFPELVENIKQK